MSRLTGLLLLGCSQGSVGSMSGLVVQNGISTSISVNFTSMTFPTTSTSSTFIIEMSNLSDNNATFTLNAPNPSGNGLAEQFPLGDYPMASAGNSFTGVVTVQGTNSADISGTGGQLTLQLLQIGQDAEGNPAVAMIRGEFVIDLADGGFVQGSFDADFTQ